MRILVSILGRTVKHSNLNRMQAEAVVNNTPTSPRAGHKATVGGASAVDYDN